MELYLLFAETAKLLGLQVDTLDNNTESVSIQLEGYPEITLEKVPERDYLALTGLLCRYPDQKITALFFESLMNAHAYGIYTNGAFFAANSELEQVIMHKLLAIVGTNAELLKKEIVNFAVILKEWQETCEQADFSRLKKHDDEESELREGLRV
jgi:hypothetical protein